MTPKATNKKAASKNQKGKAKRGKTSDPNQNTYNDLAEIKEVMIITLTFIIIGALTAIISFVSNNWLLG